MTPDRYYLELEISDDSPQAQALRAVSSNASADKRVSAHVSPRAREKYRTPYGSDPFETLPQAVLDAIDSGVNVYTHPENGWDHTDARLAGSVFSREGRPQWANSKLMDKKVLARRRDPNLPGDA